MNVKKYIGAAFKIVIALVVIAFLGLRSLDFFYFITPPEQFYYAYLGFGLTGGGVIAYLVIFLWDADSPLKKAVAIGMLFFCVLGELVTAGFGLKINAWKAAGYQLTNAQFESMILAIQAFGLIHATALILYVAGDPIIWAFQDEDGDGVPNALDPVNNRTGQPTKGKGILSMFKKDKPIPAPVDTSRQFNLSDEQIAKLMVLLNEQKVGQGAGGNGVNPTHQPHQ